jgi:nuclear transport factor 2 (NTF2) superfamily protein
VLATTSFLKIKAMEQRHPLPPFSMDTALQKVQMAEDAWNSKDPKE